MIDIWVRFIIPVQKLGAVPYKISGAKNVRNLARFYTTSDFDRQYLRSNKTRYPKSERHVISSYSSRVQPNKSGELWSTIQKVVHVSLDPPKLIFSGDHISAPRRWPLKFLHALQFDQDLPAHTTNRVGGPPKILRVNS